MRFRAGITTSGVAGLPGTIMMIYGMDGQLLDEPTMLVAGTEDGFNKPWLYQLVQPGSALSAGSEK